MFIFLLTPFDTLDCYYFESNLSLVSLIKVLLIKNHGVEVVIQGIAYRRGRCSNFYTMRRFSLTIAFLIIFEIYNQHGFNCNLVCQKNLQSQLFCQNTVLKISETSRKPHEVLFDIVESLQVKFYQRKENPMMFRSVSGLLLLDIESHAFL